MNERKEKLVTQEKQGEQKSMLSSWSKWEKASRCAGNGKQQCASHGEAPVPLKLTLPPLVSPASQQREETVHR